MHLCLGPKILPAKYRQKVRVNPYGFCIIFEENDIVMQLSSHFKFFYNLLSIKRFACAYIFFNFL